MEFYALFGVDQAPKKLRRYIIVYHLLCVVISKVFIDAVPSHLK